MDAEIKFMSQQRLSLHMNILPRSYFSNIFDDRDIYQVYAQWPVSDQEQSYDNSKIMQDKTAALRRSRPLIISYHSH